MWKNKMRNKDIVISEGKRQRQRKYTITLLLMSVPGLIGLILFNYLPMFGVVIAFKDYVPLKGLFGSEWCGLENFEFFFKSRDAFRIIRNTVLYSLEFLVLDLVLGVFMAILLYNLKKGVKVYHTIIMLPKFVSIVIVSFITYAMLSPTYGVINQVITFFGGTGVQWYSEAALWPMIITVVHSWMVVGSGCLYYYSGLMAIDPSLFEAAELDGANTIQKAWYISVPELIPIMVIMTILGIGHIFSGDMGLFYQIPRNQGILYETTDIINTYVYRALLSADFAKSAAVGLFQSAVGFVLVVGTNAIVRRVSPENSLF